MAGCSQAIWQVKVPPDLQGRVYSVRRTIASECGFFDQSHFTKTFNAQEHMPPSRYRRKARGG
jgi:YesN/AraC family two-component response regulator